MSGLVALAVLANGAPCELSAEIPASPRGVRIEVFSPDDRNANDFDPAQSAGLFIGIRQFEDSAFTEVPFAVDDAVDLAYLFAFELRLVLPSKIVLALAGKPQKPASVMRLEALREAHAVEKLATRAALVDQFRALRVASGSQGLLIVTVATHGFNEQGGDFLVAADSRKLQITSTGLAVNRLFFDVAQTPSARRIVLLDACREFLSRGTRGLPPDPSVAMSWSFAAAMAAAEGQVVLSATTVGGWSYDDFKRRNGVFSAAVVDGLQGEAPADERDFITVHSLSEYVNDQVFAWVQANRQKDRQSRGIQRQFEGRVVHMPLAMGGARQGGAHSDPQRREQALGRLDSIAEPWVEPIIGMRFRYIPSGSFEMGSDATEMARGSDETQHRVTLTRGLWIGETEVTQGQWTAVMGTQPSFFTQCGTDCPVERVSWFDAIAFANRLSQRAKLEPCYRLTACTGGPGGGCDPGAEWCDGDHHCTVTTTNSICRGFRLPTEAEWEYAARGGTSTPFWTGDDLTVDQANHDGNRPYWGKLRGLYRAMPVAAGSLPANPIGLREVHGNVWEWLWDWKGNYVQARPIDPTGSTAGEERVVRGGSWRNPAHSCRVANRNAMPPATRNHRLGFRLARTTD